MGSAATGLWALRQPPILDQHSLRKGTLMAAQPARVTNSQLYDGITREYATWFTAARNAGITR